MIRGRDNKRKELINILSKSIPEELLLEIPHRWWYVGDICIVSIPVHLFEFKEIIGSAFLFLEQGKARTVLGRIGPTSGIIRTPSFEYLAGDKNTETIHKELGCYFKIDAAKLTFSPGNHGERERMMNIASEGETIIDMFSCVGNLSLPIAVYKSPKQLIAAEINPLAFDYLIENITLNKVQNRMKAILGDNRITLRDYYGKADRVISGFLESDDKQIQSAIRLCKKGAILHYHETMPISKKDRPINKLMKIASNENREIEKITKRKVKKYSPGIEHIVIDAIIY